MNRIGAWTWIGGMVVFAVAHLVTEWAWPIPYSWAGNNISDLGNVTCGIWDDTRPRPVCSPLHEVMNTAIVVAGLALATGAVLVRDVWRGRALAARTLLVVCGGAYVLVGLVPADVDDNLHLLGALLIMGGGNLALVIGAAAARLRVLTGGAGLVAITAGGLFFLQVDPGIGLGGMERVAVFALQVWIIVVAVEALTRSRRGTRGAVGSRV